MPADEVDAYLAAQREPHRSTLEALRATILELVPHAEQAISYGVPAFKVEGRAIAGFAAYTGHLSYLPHSGSVLEQLGDRVSGYQRSKGALTFPVDEPLPRDVVAALVAARLRELGLPSPS